VSNIFPKYDTMDKCYNSTPNRVVVVLGKGGAATVHEMCCFN